MGCGNKSQEQTGAETCEFQLLSIFLLTRGLSVLRGNFSYDLLSICFFIVCTLPAVSESFVTSNYRSTIDVKKEKNKEGFWLKCVETHQHFN